MKHGCKPSFMVIDEYNSDKVVRIKTTIGTLKEGAQYKVLRSYPNGDVEIFVPKKFNQRSQVRLATTMFEYV